MALDLPGGLDVLNRRTRYVRMALLAYIAISLADVAVVLGEMTGAVDIEAAGDLDPAASLAALVHLLFVIAMLGAIVIVAMWIHRAHANLRDAGIDGLEYSPGWAVGWYFIPFANLVKPFRAMRELWSTSLAQSDSYADEADPRLKLWWGAWIVGNILSNVALRFQGLDGSGATPVGYVLDIFSTLVLAAAGWFLLRIVEEVNDAQRSGATMAQAFA
jgi:hypothetical protein